jgi:hypothetical protein
MRFLNVILGVVGVGALATAGVVGCGSSNGSTGTTGTSTTTGSASTSTGGPKSCAPSAACTTTAPDKDCLGLVDNKGQTKFGLRMSELDVTAPHALTTGIVANVVSGAVQQNLMACNLQGTATFNWLLQFDTTAGTLRTGGAKPVMDPTMGYSFDNETIMGQMIAPITVPAKPDATTGAFSVMTGMDLVVPIFLNAQATSVVILPLKQARIAMGTITSNNNCIGTYNATGLQPSNSCLPDPMASPPIPQYITAGALDGYILLEDADKVQISSIQQTLCVLLSGNASMYGMPGMGGLTVCKRDASMKIVYQGGWCSTTNMAAAAGCADAEHLSAEVAASSDQISH